MSTTPEGDPGAAPPGWTAADIPDQVGRTFIVTGGNSGPGFETSRELARRGAQVILTARDAEKGAAAVAAILDEQPDAQVETRLVDLADLDSVEAFARTVEQVDVLINNAGVMMPPRAESAQGYESQFAVNHLAHFALTAMLLDVLKQGRDPRVVTVSSYLHKRGRIHFDDLHGEHNYSRTGYYAQSKLANVVFGLELHRRLRANGFAVASVLAHPGYAATNLQTTGPTGVTKLALKVSNRILAQEAAMGALPQLYAATNPDVESGQFIGPDGRKEQKGYPKIVWPLEAARDRELAKRLWDISEELCGLSFGLAVR
ncbi:oxidoreductase [Actinokineospora iranica]|uniref:NAD(P)-dependent dehydrogenase, short-chain alcohol dehydrogenase family n=1 Tax=Actinokineospora iranica TaxID=1271860 RepID=A0A1G6PDS8_9PSEU|nr:oxidoreductase [Actinokineospora iranica]SDC78209.1 NAD(P)-dependent dehydrogenase, short-chain alcohol dehydrogenase family [Actinokineospora iranica]